MNKCWQKEKKKTNTTTKLYRIGFLTLVDSTNTFSPKHSTLPSPQNEQYFDIIYNNEYWKIATIYTLYSISKYRIQ